MHLSYVFAGHGFDYKAAVVGGQEAVAEATLRVAVERRAPRQRVLSRRRHNLSQQEKHSASKRQSFRFEIFCLFNDQSVGIHLIVLVVDTKTLPQVSEHHGTVLLNLKATGQVFSGNKDTRESDVNQKGMRKRCFG